MDTNKAKTILDVRTPDEFNQDHVEGALNIPIDQVASRIDEIKALPKPIVTYCGSGKRAGMAVSILNENGISDVTNGGGISDMKQANK